MSALRGSVKFALVASAAAVGVLGAVVIGPVQPAVVEASSSLGAGGEMHIIDPPRRILDTRPANAINDRDRPGAKVLPALHAPGERFEVQVLGQGGLPAEPSRVLGVLVNITVVEPTQAGYLSAWGSNRARNSESSIVNFAANQTVPNSALVMPGDGGKLTVELVGYGQGVSGQAHVLIDVAGWISSSSNPDTGLRVVPAGPQLIYESRTNALGHPLGIAQTVPIPIRGVGVDGTQVPATAQAVLLNITAFNDLPGSAPTYVSAVPYDLAPGTEPSTSTLNLARGEIKSNLAIVPVPADGAIRAFNSAGMVHLEVSIVGYLASGTPGTRAGRVVPLETPFRIIDTRHGIAGAPQGRLSAGMAEDWDFAEAAAQVRVGGSQVGPQSGFLANLTVAGIERPAGWYGRIDSYVAAYPSIAGPGGQPRTRNVQVRDGAAVPNMGLFRYGSGDQEYRLRVYNEAGNVNYLFDIAAVILAD